MYLVLTTCVERISAQDTQTEAFLSVVICHYYFWLEIESHNCSLLTAVLFSSRLHRGLKIETHL